MHSRRCRRSSCRALLAILPEALGALHRIRDPRRSKALGFGALARIDLSDAVIHELFACAMRGLARALPARPADYRDEEHDQKCHRSHVEKTVATVSGSPTAVVDP